MSLLRILQLSDNSIRYKILHFVTKFCQNIKNVEITLWDNVAQYSDVEIISKGMSSSRSSSRLILNFIINPMIVYKLWRGEEGQPHQFPALATFFSFLVRATTKNCLILQDETIFLRIGPYILGHKWKIDRKKSLNWVKLFEFNGLKNIFLSTRIFRYSWCRIPQVIPGL